MLWLLWTMLWGCWGGDGPDAGPVGVIIISMDTVRWDHTSLGGYHHDTTPNLARLAAEPGAVRFDRAYTPASWSLPAYASLFTGQEALTHGLGFTRDTVEPTTRTLAGVLQAYGYQTRALCSGPHLVAQQGFDRGFDSYEHNTSALPITAAVTGALRWLEDDRDPESPFFLFIQGYDAHFPYGTPAALSELFDVSEPARPDGGCAKSCGAARKNNGWRCASQLLQEQGTASLSAAQVEHVVAHYDAAVYYADYQLGRLLHQLEALGLYDDVIIAVISDHGEGLGEEGRLGHDWDCSEDIFHVPLVIRTPSGVPPLQRQAVVSLSGLAPTLLEFVGIEPPVEADAESFAALLSPEAPDAVVGTGIVRSASKQCYTARDSQWRYTEPWAGTDWTPLPPRLQRDGYGPDLSDTAPEDAARLAGAITDWPRGMDLNEINERAGRDDPILQQALQDGGYWSAPSTPAPEAP
ncbi:MAG: arylsulfatase A-like enzyme [Myxococcota bacterium]|jgi:arylsulfatase A-like enzyme